MYVCSGVEYWVQRFPRLSLSTKQMSTSETEKCKEKQSGVIVAAKSCEMFQGKGQGRTNT